MSPKELVVAVQAAGGEVKRFSDGRAVVTGTVPADLVERIKVDRETFLDAWEASQRNRWGEAPPESLPFRNKPPEWRRKGFQWVEGFHQRQGSEVCAWVSRRTHCYCERGMTIGDAAPSALADVVQWQFPHWKDPVGQIETFKEVADAFRRNL